MSAWWETAAESTWDAPKTDDAAATDAKWESKDANGWDAPAATEVTAWGTDKDAQAGDQAWGQSSWDDKPQGPPPATEYWDTQKWYKENGTLPRKEDWELERDDEALFDLKGRAQAGMNFSMYEAVPVDISGSKADKIPVCKTFEDIFTKFRTLIPEALEANLKKVGYSTPTPCQKFAVPCGLVGRDVMCCAQTGSGKTAAFLIPIIGRMMKHHEKPMGTLEVPFEGAVVPDTLVMTPTRELCIQIFEEAQKFCHRTPYNVNRVYGGAKAKEQQVEIAKGADLLVATPGRLKDFMSRGIVAVEKVHVLVLDEADRMLDMGFEADIREIVEQNSMPPKEERQTMMFSATFPEAIQTLAQDYMYDHIWIAVGVLNGAVETVKQELKKVTPAEKFEELISTLDQFYKERQNSERLLVFVNAKDTAKWLDEQLYEKKFDSGALHGNLDQSERETNLGRFRRGEIDVLIATDVAARGLDIENVGTVVNYDMPRDSDTYIHRIGRTGRIGNAGRALTFLSCDESGACLEQVDLLKQLVTVMSNSKASMPEWLQGLIDTQEAANDWSSWGAKDAREGQEGNTWTGAGDTWGASANTWSDDKDKTEEATASAQDAAWQADRTEGGAQDTWQEAAAAVSGAQEVAWQQEGAAQDTWQEASL